MSSLIEAQRTIDELTKELELTRNEKAKFEKKVADLTEERDNIKAECYSFKHQLTVMKTDRDNWKKIAETKAKDLDHLKVHYDCCISDRDTYKNKVTSLTAEVGKLKKELEEMTHLNDLNVGEVQKLTREKDEFLDDRRSLATTVSQLEKRLADTKETVNILNAANDATNKDNHELRIENDKLRTVNQESGKLLLLGYEALANAVIKIK